MTAAHLLETIDNVARDLCHNNLPFGGKRVIAAGDLFQLPPVPHIQLVLKEEWIELSHGEPTVHPADTSSEPECIFFSNLWQHFKAVELTASHRQQSDPAFCAALSELRKDGQKPQLEQLLSNRRKEEAPPNAITLCARRSEVHAVNMKRIAASAQPGHNYAAVDIITTQELKTTPTLYTDADALPLRIGAPALCLMNLDVAHGLANGTFLVIESCDTDSIRVRHATHSGLQHTTLWRATHRFQPKGPADKAERHQLTDGNHRPHAFLG